MGGKLGRKMLLKMGDGAAPEVFTPVATLTTKSFSLNGSDIDSTADDSKDGNDLLWTETLRGINSASVSGDGRIKDSPTEKALFALFFEAENKANWEVVIPGLGTITGPFRLNQLEAGGETTGDGTYGMQLNSAGACVFTAEGA